MTIKSFISALEGTCNGDVAGGYLWPRKAFRCFYFKEVIVWHAYRNAEIGGS